MKSIFALIASTVTLLTAPRAEDVAQFDYTASAVFAGGCFWCGLKPNPTYRDHEGHLEVAQIPYDPNVISYRELVDYFFRHIDPLDDGGQFCDRGHSYTTAVFYANADEYAAATASKEAAEAELGQSVVTPLIEFTQFWKAEDYHQDYYKKNPVRYKFYRTSCGRDRRVKQVWGDR